MPRAGIEPATRGFSVRCSTNWAIWASHTVASGYRCLRRSSGDRIWTCNLRVMSPTSFRIALPRVVSTREVGGDGFEPSKQFAADLQSVPFGHSGIHPYWFFKDQKPTIGIEPITCWLQISCSANWATSALKTTERFGKRPRTDLNRWPPPWQGGALTNWATGPYDQSAPSKPKPNNHLNILHSR